MTTATLTIKQAISIIQNASPDITICLRGRHAIGKSEIVYQAARLLNLPVVERRLSQVTEGDLIGLPVLNADAKSTSFKPCDWLMEAVEKPVLLFLDERNRALPAVKQSVFQLCDSRTFYGYKLHKDTRIVIAENLGASYQVEVNDPAEVSRCATCNLDPTVEEWLNYAREQKLPSVVVSFITANERCLEHKGVFEPNEKYPDRRSWFKFARECERLNLLKDVEATQALMLPLAQMMLGVETASAFHQYAVETTKRIALEDILTDWDKLAKRLKGTDPQIPREYILECMSKVKDFLDTKPPISDTEFSNLSKFFTVLPPELILGIMGSSAMAVAGNLIDPTKTTKASANMSKLTKILANKISSAYQTGSITEESFKQKSEP